jgi:hypothetical protein
MIMNIFIYLITGISMKILSIKNRERLACPLPHKAGISGTVPPRRGATGSPKHSQTRIKHFLPIYNFKMYSDELIFCQTITKILIKLCILMFLTANGLKDPFKNLHSIT